MKVIYVTCRFPAPSEAFACVDVSEIKRQGWDISVLGLLPRLRKHSQLIRERGLTDIPIEVMRGFLYIFEGRVNWKKNKKELYHELKRYLKYEENVGRLVEVAKLMFRPANPQ